MAERVRDFIANFNVRSILLIGGGLLVLGCFSIFLGQNLIFEAGVRLGIFAPSPIRQYEAVDQTEAGWYNAFFTNPACLPEWRRHDGLDQLIADDIRSAGDRVDLAAFELNATPIISALRDVASAGKEVRVVVDSAETEAGVMDRLRSAGVEIVGDERSALMHNKFVIIDDQVVWTGSLNFTDNGSYCNANNVVRMISPQLADNYTAEMDEMINGRSFGPTSPDNTPHERMSIDGVAVENYFAAEKEVAPIIAAYVADATEEILFMAYSFTEETIGEAVIEQARSGTTVQGVFETTGSETAYSYFNRLDSMRAPNVMVRQDGSSTVMHHKVFILDRETVIFGSFNFTNSANDENDENIVIVKDPALAAQFAAEFAAVWREAPGLDDWFWQTIGIEF